MGELNYKHFLFFLALHSATFFYGSSRIWGVLGKEIREKQLWEATFYSPSSGRTVSASPTVVLQYLVVHEGALCGVLALCTVMAVVLLGFWLYHLSLVFRNTTTNETFKWSAVRAQAKQARSQAQRAHEASGKSSSNHGNVEGKKNVFLLTHTPYTYVQAAPFPSGRSATRSTATTSPCWPMSRRFCSQEASGQEQEQQRVVEKPQQQQEKQRRPHQPPPRRRTSNL